MGTFGCIVGLIFLYVLFAHFASRLFERFDPSSAYSNQSPGTWRSEHDHKDYPKMSPCDWHAAYIIFGSVLWPASLSIWTVGFILWTLPHRIVLRVERYGPDQRGVQGGNGNGRLSKR